MATKILIKKSVTGGASPLAGDIDQAELAVNLVDRKIYTKDNSGAIITLDGAYVDSTAPGNPAEGDLWYDTTNNVLKVHNGSSFVSAGYQNLSDLEDVTITSVAAGEILKWSGSAFINNTLAEAGIAAASDIPTNNNQLTNGAGYITGYTVTQGDVTAHQDALSITESQISDLGTYLTSYTETDTLENVTGRGATSSSAISITNNTASSTTSNGALTVTGGVGIGGALNVGGNTTITGNLTVNGTTTTVNSNTVNIGDNIIVLNSDETGTPSQDGGITIERGTSSNVSFFWDESEDKWSLGNQELADVTIDAGTY
jgi:hypothetical protein